MSASRRRRLSTKIGLLLCLSGGLTCCIDSFLVPTCPGAKLPRSGYSKTASTSSSQLHVFERSDDAKTFHQVDRRNHTKILMIGHLDDVDVARRVSITSVVMAATAPLVANAGKPELDSSGELYSPRTVMMSGGSDAARGIASVSTKSELKPGQALQTVYGTRFIAYLSRFLLTFDPAAHAWWLKQGLGDSWEINDRDASVAQYKFAEFAESVEVGLADYFLGPYGSYSSVEAAKAGFLASNPARSMRSSDQRNFFESLLGDRYEKTVKPSTSKSNSALTKQGILNLLALLKARYTSIVEKRQLAFLFSMISDPLLQPTLEIKGLLGEADNATVTKVELIRPPPQADDVRRSSRLGGGYTYNITPSVLIEVPPALGADYKPAQLEAKMKPTSRILKIIVTDPGEGYTMPPIVTVQSNTYKRPCQACAIVNRAGRIAEVLVLDPGYGYLIKSNSTLEVSIAPPKQAKGSAKPVRQAKAVAEMEYEIDYIAVVNGGNGYYNSGPPEVFITPPKEDPDWFVEVQEQPQMMVSSKKKAGAISAKVTEMSRPDGNPLLSVNDVAGQAQVDMALINRLARDPLELLPTSIGLEPTKDSSTNTTIYKISSLPPIPLSTKVPSPRYRAIDPIFGAVGRVPVTKGAVALKASEYARLALSGAVCTVLVRTALNPLELIKTKQQLGTDIELLEFARKRVIEVGNDGVGDNLEQEDEIQIETDSRSRGNCAQSLTVVTNVATQVVKEKTKESTIPVKEAAGLHETECVSSEPDNQSVKLGTLDLITSLIELRGAPALFQSADITFIASLMFGSFGFGATELFRRVFTAIFFTETEGATSDGSKILTLLAAAALATVVTAAAASPFELLRVKSMSRLEPVGWTEELDDFIQENRQNKKPSRHGRRANSPEEIQMNSTTVQDYLPLFRGFAPTLSRELPFAVVKFLAFDVISSSVIQFINSQTAEGALPIQVGVGPAGLTISAFAGAFAGIAGAIVSHPADLILTKTSAPSEKTINSDGSIESAPPVDWKDVVKDLLGEEGGVFNLFLGFPARATFFFLVIGLQFFLYDYVKGLFQVGTDDLSLVLDVFYAVRTGLVAGMEN